MVQKNFFTEKPFLTGKYIFHVSLHPFQGGKSWQPTQKMKFSIKDFFSKCEQIRRELQIWSHLLKKSLLEKLIFCAATVVQS